MSFFLSNEEKKYLLQLARASIQSFLENKVKPQTEYFSPTLKTESGIFVTLHKNDDLRGCIGYVHGYRPLQDAVSEMAISAAFNDPRFHPVTRDELPLLEIEISVLSPLTKIQDLSEIEIGRDGLLIKQNHREGLLLPQVATEYHWDRQTFLEQTCRKAGLPAQAWQEENTEIFRFSAIIFNEQDFS